MRSLNLRLVSLVGAAAAGALLAGVAGIGPAMADPPGSNGTVKVDGAEFDGHGNEPHVGCTFEIDFYGYDEGEIFADVTFTSQAPTVGPDGSQVLKTDRVFVGEDSNAGGASESGLDASATYTVDFNGIDAHPIQGYHVELTVSTPGKRGLETKHKVLWTSSDCGGEAPPDLPF